jgi:hypothetical protein
MRRDVSILFIIPFTLSILAATAAQAAEAPALLSQVQAADVLSDLITWSADRAAARADSMQQYLREINQFDAFTHAPPPSTAPAAAPTATQPLFYDQTFAGAVRFVEQGGDQYADPALKKFNSSQLMKELSALASYNIKQFEYLNQQRASVAAMKNYLQSVGKLRAYIKWAAKRTPESKVSPVASGTAGSSSSPKSSSEMVAQTEAMMQAARATALKRAEAAGTSPSDFDKQWNQKQTEMRADISKRLEGMSDLAAAFSKLASAKPEPLTASRRGASHPEISPQSEPFGDPFATTYQGPGEYRLFDTRINFNDDQRVNGEYDRRANLGFDRRLNIRITPRQGV